MRYSPRNDFGGLKRNWLIGSSPFFWRNASLFVSAIVLPDLGGYTKMQFAG